MYHLRSLRIVSPFSKKPITFERKYLHLLGVTHNYHPYLITGLCISLDQRRRGSLCNYNISEIRVNA